MKKFYQIDEFFPAAGDERFSMTAESPLDNVDYAIFSAADFADAAIYDYGERKFYCPETDTPLSSFYARFSVWKTQRGADIAAAYGTLRKSYDPLQNYSATEIKTGTETGLQTPTNWKETTTETPGIIRTETQTPNNWTKSTTDSATNYHETTTETPGIGRGTTETESFTNYHETETQTPTDWIETTSEGVGASGYHEIETQTPTNWKEVTEGLAADNEANSTNSVFAFNSASNDPVPANSVTASSKNKTTVERQGTFENDRSITGSKETSTARTGSFETDLTREGSKTVSRTETGTLETDMTISGTKTSAETQTGTFATVSTATGIDTVEKAQTGTFEDKMTYNTTLTRSGNIGVTTSQQMAESELKLRKVQFVKEVIREFFDAVTVYC